ncbi:MAG: endonuclease [Cyclobacteriaceae bacterium]|nr:MAG: endonuclease [Cyclobacteriaceae bacterium]
MVLALTGCVGYMSYFIYPYTFLASPQVLSTDPDPERSISLLTANVFQGNRDAQPCIELIKQKDPDLVLLLETDQWWVDRIAVIENQYPYKVTVPLDNAYGMALYSKIPMINPKVEYLMEKKVPSIHVALELPYGKTIKLHCLHPKPPSPTEKDTSIPRDAELMLVAKLTGFNDYPTIVAGDLNDVAWSHTTRLFQRVSGLLDPRKGRGFFNTFHAKIPIFRWPLDHVFHSNDFKLVAIERLPDIGSDHFPIYINLQYQKTAEQQQDEPTADRQDQKEATEKIQEGIEAN